MNFEQTDMSPYTQNSHSPLAAVAYSPKMVVSVIYITNRRMLTDSQSLPTNSCLPNCVKQSWKTTYVYTALFTKIPLDE